MKHASIYFDIETGPLPESELRAIMPPFDPDSVKCGNLKDPEKIAAKIAESKASYESDYINNAALDALTGRVLCIGLLQSGIFTGLCDPDESKLLAEFWSMVAGRRLVGFNTHLFDLPFLIRRSLKYGLRPPEGIRKGRYWSDDMVDLRDLWQMGDRQAHGSLDSIAKHFGVGAKTGNGKDFAKLWATDRLKALDYLQTDLFLTAAIAQRMGE